jgi:hypothetical protein
MNWERYLTGMGETSDAYNNLKKTQVKAIFERHSWSRWINIKPLVLA